MQVVEGYWGFRSTALLGFFREYCVRVTWRTLKWQDPKNKSVKLERQEVIEILCNLLLGQPLSLDQPRRYTHCVGVVKKRTLLTASLVRPCDCPDAVGRFVLLDVDVGGIPRDNKGVVRPGEPDIGLITIEGDQQHRLVGRDDGTMSEDLTRHIEADWSGNRDRLLLTFRYKGRRLISLNPAETDAWVCDGYVNPVHLTSTTTSNGLSNAVSTGVDDLLDGNLRVGTSDERPVLFQAYNHPNLRYVAVGVYRHHYPRLASDCVQTAYESSLKSPGSVIVAAEGPCGQAIRETAAKGFLPGRT